MLFISMGALLRPPTPPGSTRSGAERVAFLFARYQHLTSLLPVAKPKAARKARARAYAGRAAGLRPWKRENAESMKVLQATTPGR